MTLGLALAAAGCGNDEQGVRAAFADLRRAWLAEDYAAVCARMSDAASREVGEIGHGEPTPCQESVATRMSALVLSRRDLVEPTIRAVDVDGDAATVSALLGGTTPGRVRFVKEDGRWKLAQVFGTSAPPPQDMR